MGQIDNQQSLEKMSRDLQSSFKKNLRDYSETLLLLILLAFVVRSFFLGSYKVASEELYPTLQHGDYVLGFKPAAGVPVPFTNHKMGQIFLEAGDLAIFKCGAEKSNRCVKRIIGMPGDILKSKDDDIYRNDVLYIKNAAFLLNELEGVVPPGQVHFLGYNKWVPFEDLEAEALLIWFSREYDTESQKFHTRWSRIGNRLH